MTDPHTSRASDGPATSILARDIDRIIVERLLGATIVGRLLPLLVWPLLWFVAHGRLELVVVGAILHATLYEQPPALTGSPEFVCFKSTE